eukprot:2314965-Rhodomonas_salina.4
MILAQYASSLTSALRERTRHPSSFAPQTATVNVHSETSNVHSETSNMHHVADGLRLRAFRDDPRAFTNYQRALRYHSATTLCYTLLVTFGGGGSNASEGVGLSCYACSPHTHT